MTAAAGEWAWPDWLPAETAPRTGEEFLGLLSNGWRVVMACPHQHSLAGVQRRYQELRANSFMQDQSDENIMRYARKECGYWSTGLRLPDVPIVDTHRAGTLRPDGLLLAGWLPLPPAARA